MKEKVTIKIPKELYEKLKEVIEDTGFSSVTEFIVFTMRMIVSGGKVKEEKKISKKEIEEVRKRLKKLGYL
jgi:metal-responsive CopG/Arc/MetJ family transcriptional regulator